jgi:putative spermidine/putrescine transport system permease protein
MLAPAAIVITLLFGGGLFIALLESLGCIAPAGVGGFTFKHYLELAMDREFRISLAVTLAIATSTTIISAALGLACALAMRGLALRRGWMNGMLQAPLAVPHLAMAVAIISLIAPSGLIARLAFLAGLIDAPSDFPVLINDRYGIGIVTAYVAKETPFVAVMTLALLLRIGDEYEALAGTLGASAWQRLRYVTLPLVAPAALSASLVVFAFIFSAFETPYLMGRPFPAMLSVVAQRRFLDENLGERPAAVAVAMVIALITAMLVWAYLRLAERLTGTQRPLLF